MFKKITGIVVAFTAVGVIVMAALSPRTEGFFPGMFDFLKCGDRIETGLPQVESGTVVAPETDSVEVVPAVPPTSLSDTLSVERQNNMISEE